MSGALPVTITLYRWAGKWGPFKVKIPCGECALTADVIQDALHQELAGVAVQLRTRDWLSKWWEPLKLVPPRGYHAPIVMVEEKIVSEGEALNRGVLTQAVINAHAARTPLRGTHLFGKENCKHCKRAKGYFEAAGHAFTYHDVVKSPAALYEMLARVKPEIGPKTPITVPQIWIDGQYIGGADQLGRHLAMPIEANPERGQNSLTAHPALRA